MRRRTQEGRGKRCYLVEERGKMKNVDKYGSRALGLKAEQQIRFIKPEKAGKHRNRSFQISKNSDLMTAGLNPGR